MVTPRVKLSNAELTFRILLAVAVFIIGGMLACPGVLLDERDIPPKVHEKPDVVKQTAHAVIEDENRTYLWFYRSYTRSKV